MSKYEGIDKPDLAVKSASNIIKRQGTQPNNASGGWFKGVMARFLIAGALFGAIMGMNSLEGEFFVRASDLVRDAVMVDFITDGEGEFLVDRITQIIDERNDEA